MKYFIQLRLACRRLLRREDGASAIEYAIVAGLIAVAIVGAASTLGGDISSLFGRISTELSEVVVSDDG